jgi:hypothetical protein
MTRFRGLWLGALLLLSGCNNYVRSSQPWFTDADAKQAPAVRSGWWVMNGPDCRFSVEAPSAAWPDCVQPIPLPPGDRLVLRVEETSGVEYLLVVGDPLIVQVLAAGDKADPPTADEYGYYGLAPRRRDPQGRITAFDVWPVLCGPPRRITNKHPFDDRTRRPWPGLKIEAGKAGCAARDAKSLRDAARRSKRFEEYGGGGQSPGFHWLRDWRPGDQTQEEWLAAQAEQSQEGS